MAKNNIGIENNVINIIGSGTNIKGDINSDGDVRIDGSLVGNLISKGKVVIGETGKVQGEIKCNNSDVSGSVEGKIIVSELLSLKETANISGDIVTNKLAIEPNAMFTGTCNMGGKSPFINNAKSEEPKLSNENKQGESAK